MKPATSRRLDGTQVLYLDRFEAHWPLRLNLDAGAHVPLHATASGKLFLWQMPKVARDALIAQLSLPKMARNTIVSAKSLRAECDRIAGPGYSTDREEFIAGLIAVAVPVQGADGASRTAIAVQGPISRITLAEAVAHMPALKAAAGRMRLLL